MNNLLYYGRMNDNEDVTTWKAYIEMPGGGVSVDFSIVNGMVLVSEVNGRKVDPRDDLSKQITKVLDRNLIRLLALRMADEKAVVSFTL